MNHHLLLVIVFQLKSDKKTNKRNLFVHWGWRSIGTIELLRAGKEKGFSY